MAFNFPNTPTEGALFSPAGGPQYTYTGGVWRVLPSTSLPLSTSVVSDTPPANPVQGQIWWESDSGSTFIWYDDASADTGQWVQQSDTSLPDAPSDGGFYVRSNGTWVSVPRYQSFSMGGRSSRDIPVPSGANKVRVNGTLLPNTSGAHYNMLQVSVSAGVFRSTAGDYTIDGFQHSTALTPTAVVNLTANQSIGGFMMTQGHEHGAIPARFEGTIVLSRPSTSTYFTSNTNGFSYTAASAWLHIYVHQYMTLAAAGSALNVLALRLTNSAGMVYQETSQLDVEWM